MTYGRAGIRSTLEALIKIQKIGSNNGQKAKHEKSECIFSHQLLYMANFNSTK